MNKNHKSTTYWDRFIRVILTLLMAGFVFLIVALILGLSLLQIIGGG